MYCIDLLCLAHLVDRQIEQKLVLICLQLSVAANTLCLAHLVDRQIEHKLVLICLQLSVAASTLCLAYLVDRQIEHKLVLVCLQLSLAASTCISVTVAHPAGSRCHTSITDVSISSQLPRCLDNNCSIGSDELEQSSYRTKVTVTVCHC